MKFLELVEKAKHLVNGFSYDSQKVINAQAGRSHVILSVKVGVTL